MPFDLLDDIAEWLLSQPELKAEFEEVVGEYTQEESVTIDDLSSIMDAFIFDHKLANGRTPFEYFLRYAAIPPHARANYQGLRKNVFSLFEIIDLVLCNINFFR